MPGILASLDRYPYGCAEQTTSRALPLLYVNDVAKRIGLASDAQLRERIDGAIARVLEMQDASGAFGIWGPSDGDMWLTSYVTDFLTRAREAKYAVRQQSFNQALDRLANYISYVQDFERAARPGPTRSTCWPATAAPRSASCATTSTPSSTTSPRRWRRPSSVPRSP